MAIRKTDSKMIGGYARKKFEKETVILVAEGMIDRADEEYAAITDIMDIMGGGIPPHLNLCREGTLVYSTEGGIKNESGI